MKKITKRINKRFNELCKDSNLYRVELSGKEIWKLYLQSFKDKDNGTFRDPESSIHNCNNCYNFVKRYGNIVTIDDEFNIQTMFDLPLDKDNEFYLPFKNISIAVKSSKIKNVFFETFNELNDLNYEKCHKNNSHFRLGVNKNKKYYDKEEADKFGVVIADKEYIFHHMHLDLPTKFVDMSGDSIESINKRYRDNKNVFKRGLDEIPLEVLQEVLDNKELLYNNDTHIGKVQQFKDYSKEYTDLLHTKRDNYAWVKSYELPQAKFKNELIGVFCHDIATGKPFDVAVNFWNEAADPARYKRAKTLASEAQVQATKQFIIDNGYESAFIRRLCNLDDIDINEIKHINNSNKEKQASIFDNIPTKAKSIKKVDFKSIDEIGMDDFMANVLPHITSLQVYLENKHADNFMSLTIANDKKAKNLFGWDNTVSVTYRNNLAGKSQLTKMVEEKGGRIDGVFRFTHSWNRLEPNRSLMDLHVFMPNCELPKDGTKGPNVKGRRVGWNRREDKMSGGVQDVDCTNQAPVGYFPVENITFPDISRLPDGDYHCMIHNWDFRTSSGKGEAEISLLGEVYNYVYPALSNLEWFTVAIVTLKKGVFTIDHKLQPKSSNKTIYNLDTNKFHNVNLVCLSPNHWGKNNVGDKEYLFLLNGCKIDKPIRSFHPVNLNNELTEFRKTLEAISNATMIEPTGKEQLSGIGFNATVRDDVVVKITKESRDKIIRIKF